MNETTLSAIDALIESFENNSYTEQHVESLLMYLVDLDEKEDKQTMIAITKVLGFCTKEFVKKSIVETLNQKETSNAVKACLLSVCWESGLDYSNYLDVIIHALLNGNEAVAIEAYTVIIEMTDSNSKVKGAIEEINHSDQKIYTPAHRIIINDSLHHLISLNNIHQENNIKQNQS